MIFGRGSRLLSFIFLLLLGGGTYQSTLSIRSPPALGPPGHEELAELAKKEAAQAESEALEPCGAWFLVHLDIGSLSSSLWPLSQEIVTL